MRLLRYMGFLGVFMSAVLHAEVREYKAVFDLTSGDTKNWETLLNNLENVSKDLKKVKLKVVVHGSALPFLLKETKFQEMRVMKLNQTGVSFVACENTMKRKNVKKEELYPFVTTVPAGVAEIIRNQHDGWAYIRIGN